MGTSAALDLAGPPPADIHEAMRLAAPRDQIAALWIHGYAGLVAGVVADLAQEFAAGDDWDAAIVRGFLRQLGRAADSLVARKHGDAVAEAVSARAAAVLAGPDEEWRDRAAAFDRGLRGPQRINPGTTADLVAAALYILLRSPSHE
jgi:triphosphoribosyl-dephospho-CoA synthase